MRRSSTQGCETCGINSTTGQLVLLLSGRQQKIFRQGRWLQYNREYRFSHFSKSRARIELEAS